MSLPEPPARKRRARRAEVLRTSAVTPHMIRVVLGGPGLADLEIGEFTDHYVKLLFAPQGADYSAPFDVEEIQGTRPRTEWPVTRTYTVRSWEAATGELTLDFVYHGDHGLAGPWAAGCSSGRHRSTSSDLAAATRPTSTPTGISSWGTRARCRRSLPPSIGLPSERRRRCSSRSRTSTSSSPCTARETST